MIILKILKIIKRLFFFILVLALVITGYRLYQLNQQKEQLIENIKETVSLEDLKEFEMPEIKLPKLDIKEKISDYVDDLEERYIE